MSETSGKNYKTVAVVDSNTAHRGQLGTMLLSYYEVMAFKDGSERTLEVIKKQKPAMVLLSAELALKTPLDFIKNLRQSSTKNSLPILFIAGKGDEAKAEKAMLAGVNGVVTKPFSRTELIRAISERLAHNVEEDWQKLPAAPRQALETSVDIFSAISNVLITGETIAFDDVKESCEPLVKVVNDEDFVTILDGVRNHDDYTYSHSMRVATLLTMLGHAAGYNHEDKLIMSSGGLLHDVGKMMIPHEILNKPGKLDEREFEIMKSHVPETVHYLEKLGHIPKGVMIIAEQHHEKIDGTGYPHGLKGKELNELARMAAIVDVFSALTDRRIYKEPLPAAKAMKIMTEEMTGHLDQHYVKLFKAVLGDHKVL